MRPPGLIPIVIALLAVIVSSKFVYSGALLGDGGLAMIGEGIMIGLLIPPVGMAGAIYGLIKERTSKGAAIGRFINALFFIAAFLVVTRII